MQGVQDRLGFYPCMASSASKQTIFKQPRSRLFNTIYFYRQICKPCALHVHCEPALSG